MPPAGRGPVFTVSRPILRGFGWAKAGAGIVSASAVPTRNPRREIVTGIASSSKSCPRTALWRAIAAPRIERKDSRVKSLVSQVAGMPLARQGGVNEFTPEQEQFITQVVNRMTRQHAQVLERVATELHALIMVLADKRVVTMDKLDAAKKQLDQAFELTRAG